MEVRPNIEKKSIKILDLWGGLTASNVDTFKKEVNAAAENNHDEIVLNFESVDHVDSSGLGAVISCYVTLHHNRKKLSLVNLNDKIREVFYYTHLAKIIKIYDRLEEIRP